MCEVKTVDVVCTIKEFNRPSHMCRLRVTEAQASFPLERYCMGQVHTTSQSNALSLGHFRPLRPIEMYLYRPVSWPLVSKVCSDFKKAELLSFD